MTTVAGVELPSRATKDPLKVQIAVKRNKIENAPSITTCLRGKALSFDRTSKSRSQRRHGVSLSLTDLVNDSQPSNQRFRMSIQSIAQLPHEHGLDSENDNQSDDSEDEPSAMHRTCSCVSERLNRKLPQISVVCVCGGRLTCHLVRQDQTTDRKRERDEARSEPRPERSLADFDCVHEQLHVLVVRPLRKLVFLL